MEPECSLPTQGDTTELEPAPAETEGQCQDRSFSFWKLSFTCCVYILNMNLSLVVVFDLFVSFWFFDYTY